MNPLSTCKIIFNLKFPEYNGLMNIKVEYNDKFIKSNINSNIIKLKIVLPCVLKLHISGKNMNTDTQIDENGDILNDKCIIIESIVLDSFKISERFLHNEIHLNDNTGPYLGENGIVTICLIKNNVFKQIMECNKKEENI